MSRVISSVNGIVGISFNALFLSILVARALQPHEPFDVVEFMLYDPATKILSTRLYSTLPVNAYNLTFRMFRFFIYNDNLGRQMGRTIEIEVSPFNRNVLLPNYGLHINANIDVEENNQNSSVKKLHKRKKYRLSG